MNKYTLFCSLFLFFLSFLPVYYNNNNMVQFMFYSRYCQNRLCIQCSSKKPSASTVWPEKWLPGCWVLIHIIYPAAPRMCTHGEKAYDSRYINTHLEKDCLLQLCKNEESTSREGQKPNTHWSMEIDKVWSWINSNVHIRDSILCFHL